MNSIEKEITYKSTNTYTTLNKLTKETEYVWFVCHGMGQLSRRFIENFKRLDVFKNFVIAVQAPSKYYHSDSYASVGGSWLTKENTKEEIDNVLRYFDAVIENENLPKTIKMIYLGFSQGVSVVTRYLASRKIGFNILVLFAGGIPSELTAEDFSHYDKKNPIIYVYGDEDFYINKERKISEEDKLKLIFSENYIIHKFKGPHTFNIDEVLKILKKTATS